MNRPALPGDFVARARAVGLATEPLEDALHLLMRCFRTGGKALIFGNGGSASHAQHLAAELVVRVRQVRRALPAMALTADATVISAIGNDFGFEQVFARQVDALGRPDDVAIAFSTSGGSPNVLAGVAAARRLGLSVLALTGPSDSELARVANVAVTTSAEGTQRIQEMHTAAVHIISEALEAWVTATDRLGLRPSTASKVVTLDDLLERRMHWRDANRIVVWTNGVFDLLHAGHVRSLEMARDLGDVLCVGVNSDDSVRIAKGESRPIVPEEQRAAIVAALAAVDFVTVFDAADPSELLRRLQPDVHCKGRDYEDLPMPERSVVEQYGGRVELLPLVPGISTTELMRRSAGDAPVLKR